MKKLIWVLLVVTVVSAEVRYHPLTGRPMILTVEGVSREHGKPAITVGRAAQIAREFLEVNGSVFGVKDIARDLVMVPVEQDRYGFSHVNFFQVHEGVEVIGGALYVHLNRKGEVTSVNGKFAPELMLSTTPAILKEHASLLAVAQAQVDMQTTDSPIAGEPRLVILPLGFIHNERDDNVHLAWQVQTDEEVSSQSVTYYLDALTGATLIGLDNVREINRRISECATATTFTGCNIPTYGRSEGSAPRGPCTIPGIAFGNSDIDSTYELIGAAHNYWLNNFGLNGANGYGGTYPWHGSPQNQYVYVYVHVDNITGHTCPNAWYQPETGSLKFCLNMVVPDVVGHEYAHSVHYYAVTDANGDWVGVAYSGESGALDESGCDIAGEALEVNHNGTNDWETPTGTPWHWRNLYDPPSMTHATRGAYPNRTNFASYYCGASDNGGVHHNGTVVSYACYLMTVGGEFNGCEFDSIGFEAVQQILYRAWAEYFTYSVTFADAVNAFQQSCIDLYDATHPEYLATVTAALQAVEMDQPGRCSGIPEVAPACALHGAGLVGHDTTVYLGQNTIVYGTGGLAGREVTFYLSAHPAVDTIWAPINVYREVMNRDTVELDGSLQANAWLADTLGVFDIIVDENSDGFYQPWADTILTVQVIEMPASLDLVTVQLNDHALIFHWKQISSSASYVLEHDDNFDFATPDTVVITSDTTATDSVNVLGNEMMFYRVRVE